MNHYYSFPAVNKSYKTLENEEGYKRCKEIVDEAKVRVDEMVRHGIRRHNLIRF